MNLDIQREKLRAFFPYLLVEEIEELISISYFKKTKNKNKIIDFNQKKPTLLFILEGIVRGYFINTKGIEKNIFLKSSGTFIGSPDSLFHDKPSRFAFESVAESQVLIFHYSDLEKSASSNPRLLKVLLSAYQENVHTLVKRVKDLIDKSPEERYEAFINENPALFQKTYNKHIANYLGITPVSLSRIIKRKEEHSTSLK